MTRPAQPANVSGSPAPPASELSRRQFGWHLAGIAAVPGMVASMSECAQGDDLRKPRPAPPAPAERGSAQPSPPSEAAPSDDESAERQQPPEYAYLLGLILRRYPDERLDEAAVHGILRDIQGDLARSAVLSSFPLENSDEPAFAFKAWRAGG